MPPRKVISKVLVANRGEIALRVLRTCRRLGIQTVVAHTVVDRDAPFVRYADSAFCIGDSYLNQDAIFAAAKKAGADAIHPGSSSRHFICCLRWSFQMI
jgi:acetyl-CoA carboxylase biotin carboxylase subunit